MLRKILTLFIAILDHLSSKKKTILDSSEKLMMFNSKKIAFFIMYNPDTYSLASLASIEKVFRKNDYDFFAIQNVDRIPKSQTTNVLFRLNKGFDLGAYRDIARFTSKSTEEILLLNDSIYWDSSLLDSLLKRLSDLNEGTYFLTESFNPFFHFQSYFMCNKGEKAIRDAKNWLETIRNWSHKTSAIEFGELRNAKYFKGSSQALFPYYDLVKTADLNLMESTLSNYSRERIEFCLENLRKGIPLNPTHHYYFELLQLGFPGIKRDLVKYNPSGVPDLESSSKILSIELPRDIILSNGAKPKQKSKMTYCARHLLRF